MYGKNRRGKNPAGASFSGLGSGENRPMSIDAMLDMERQEVLALLEDGSEKKNKNKTSHVQPAQAADSERRSASPYATRSPVRSMLDIDEEPSKPSPSRQKVRSMLDFDVPVSTSTARGSSNSRGGSSTTPNSPVLSNASMFSGVTSSQAAQHARSMSDAQFKDTGIGPRLPASRASQDPTAAYQFSKIYGPNSGLPSNKKNVSSGGSKDNNSRRGSLGDALRNDLGSLSLPGERGRHSSLSGMSGRLSNKSKSPAGRLASRSRSPATFQPKLPQGKGYLADGRIVDLNSAYRRLSDANLITSSGSLSKLPMRKQSVGPGEGRLHKDYRGPDGEHLDSSDEDEPYSTDDEDRGRKKAPRPLNPDARGESGQSKSRSRSNQRKTHSLLAAAEEERTQIASQQPKYQYRSLIPEPEIKVTSSSGDPSRSRSFVHPHTSFDYPGSATASQIDSDEEQEVDDIKKAQKLNMNKTPIISQPENHRSVRIIFRGEYQKIAQAAEEEHKRGRKYLAATDLSDESTHALEWAIGTVLRDGDTLIAIYCVDEETGIVTGDGSQVPDDPKAMRDQAAMINSVSNSQAAPGPMTALIDPPRRTGALGFRSPVGTPGTSPAPSGRGEQNKAIEERNRAVEAITEKVFKLLRKTQLQVKVIVEVIHCKNPKHLITEVIDVVEPTLVVIGSRGRSALKGVILGSFSNYLVTKSSVPVMVARKRLRKQSQYKNRAVRQVNNLSNPSARSLANAKVD